MTLLDALQRATSDAAFAEQISNGEAWDQLSLSDEERDALRSADEDAIRRMAGVAANAQYVLIKWISE